MAEPASLVQMIYTMEKILKSLALVKISHAHGQSV